MAQVTYRGVKYDTNDRKDSVQSASQLTYRGIKQSTQVRLVLPIRIKREGCYPPFFML